MRRSLSLLFGFTAAALMAGATSAAEEKKAEDPHAAHFSACAKACADCMLECESCSRHCADMVANGKKEHVATLGACRDCAEFCATSAKIVANRGPMAGLACESCAKACDTCATQCEKFADDAHMARCAKSCRDCAKSCREMLKHVAEPAK
jgi:hypothetical protein